MQISHALTCLRGAASWIWDVSVALIHVCDGQKQLVSLNTIVLKKSRLSLIVRVNVVLNKTVVDSDLKNIIKRY